MTEYHIKVSDMSEQEWALLTDAFPSREITSLNQRQRLGINFISFLMEFLSF